MRTNLPLTRSISIAAPPAAVLDLVGDPIAIPRWAPRFGQKVRPAGDGTWLVDEARVRVRVSRAFGTVDFLAPDSERGAFTRVVANGGGSEFTFTLFMPHGAPDADVERQAAVIEQELEAVRRLCEA